MLFMESAEQYCKDNWPAETDRGYVGLLIFQSLTFIIFVNIGKVIRIFCPSSECFSMHCILALIIFVIDSSVLTLFDQRTCSSLSFE